MSVDDTIAAFREFTVAMETMRREAFAADPGLEAAWHAARFKDKDIGWLDVALRRERQRNNREGRR